MEISTNVFHICYSLRINKASSSQAQNKKLSVVGNHYNHLILKRIYPLTQETQVMLEVEEFEHRALPGAIVDWQIPRGKKREANGRLRAEIINNDYVAMQLTRFSDVIDCEQC